MPARNKIPPEIVRETIELIESGSGNEESQGAEIRDKYPAVFGPTTTGRSVMQSIKREAVRLGLEIPKRPNNWTNRRPAPRAVTSYLEASPELRLQHRERVLVFGDAHLPTHFEAGIERIAEAIRRLRIERVVLNGDTFNNAYLGHKGIRDARVESYAQQRDAVASLIDYLEDAALAVADEAPEFVWNPGNHEDKVWRQGDREWNDRGGPHLQLVEGAIGRLEDRRCRHVTTERYYHLMMPRNRGRVRWPYAPDDFPWLICHQKEFRRMQLSAARDIANSYLCHVWTSHDHAHARGHAPSGVLRLVNGPCVQDPRLTPYKNDRPSAHNQWVPGFGVLLYGVPELCDFRNPAEWWEGFFRRAAQ